MATIVLVAKSPTSGASKTRLTHQLAAFRNGESASSSLETELQLADAQRWTAAFSRASVKDLVTRISRRLHSQGFSTGHCILLYSPPNDAARAYFAELLAEVGSCGSGWTLMPVLARSDARSSDLGGVLADAMTRALSRPGCTRVCFLGSDCPELPIESISECMSAAEDTGVAGLCPASDGGYTFLALPAEANAASAFDAVHWSAPDTALSQLAALSRAGLRCHVGPTHADVDELDDLRALSARLRASERLSALCPSTAALCAEMRPVLEPGLGAAEEDRAAVDDTDSTGAT